MSEPLLLLLTGPAGAGKTSVADAWARKQTSPTAHLSLDDIRCLVKSGYANPEQGWTMYSQQQYEFARDACAELGRRYSQIGYSCVIDDAIFPEWQAVGYEGWSRVLGSTPHKLIVLLPSFEAVLVRNQGRDEKRTLKEDMIKTIYEMMLPWKEQEQFPVIDTTALSLEESVTALEHMLAFS